MTRCLPRIFQHFSILCERMFPSSQYSDFFLSSVYACLPPSLSCGISFTYSFYLFRLESLLISFMALSLSCPGWNVLLPLGLSKLLRSELLCIYLIMSLIIQARDTPVLHIAFLPTDPLYSLNLPILPIESLSIFFLVFGFLIFITKPNALPGYCIQVAIKLDADRIQLPQVIEKQWIPFIMLSSGIVLIQSDVIIYLKLYVLCVCVLYVFLKYNYQFKTKIYSVSVTSILIFSQVN